MLAQKIIKVDEQCIYARQERTTRHNPITWQATHRMTIVSCLALAIWAIERMSTNIISTPLLSFQVFLQPLFVGRQLHVDARCHVRRVQRAVRGDAKNNPTTIRLTYQERTTGVTALIQNKDTKRLDKEASLSLSVVYHCVDSLIIITCTDLRSWIEDILVGSSAMSVVKDTNVS